MKILGINALNHDAAITVLHHGRIVWAAHSERYSKVKNDCYLNQQIVDEALSYGQPDVIAYYERPWAKKTRQIYAGQWGEVFKLDNIPHFHIRKFGLTAPIKYVEHHKSHAAAGYYTSKFDKAAVLVVDSIGEWTTTSIWCGENNQLTKMYDVDYPKSVGLFYSAFTHLLGLKPNEDEYILMGMAAYGKPKRYYEEVKKISKLNLHRGVRKWPYPIATEQDKFDIAAAVQIVYEEYFCSLLKLTREKVDSDNLVFVGGCALNCSANRLIGKYFKDVWIMPNPGDAGSSLGAAAAIHEDKIPWKTAYLGTEIPGKYPVDLAIRHLLNYKIVGVASGRAEFGPRALGNRSLLADPRDASVKERVNTIKQRQQFRPFSPVILEELAEVYFELPNGWKSSPYMQVVSKCKRPKDFPGIVHEDGTSRVQTVGRDGSGIRALLEEWYAHTGCPMLLNTSLNIKGKPIVNDRADAIKFEKLYNVKVCT